MLLMLAGLSAGMPETFAQDAPDPSPFLRIKDFAFMRVN